MRIRKVSVTSLFGLFDHTVELNEDERITIIHAQNGFGKTTLLSLLYSLTEGDSYTFQSVPFNTFRVEFDTKEYLWVRKSGHERQLPLFEEAEFPSDGTDDFDETSIEFEWHLPEGDIDTHTFKDPPPHLKRSTRFFLEGLDIGIPGLERISGTRWLDHSTNQVLSYSNVLRKYGRQLGIPRELFLPDEELSDWLKKHLGSLCIRLVEAQRLRRFDRAVSPSEWRFHRTGPVVPFAIVDYAEELAKAIQAETVKYANLSQTLDKTFPQRLIDRADADILSEAELSQRLDKIEIQRTNLIKVGLLEHDKEASFQIPPQVDAQTQKVLSFYVRDMEKKLGVFNELSTKIELLQEFVNSRFRYKKMSIMRDRGFVFHTHDDKEVPLTALSSGEQHELVLFYEMLFKLKKDALILIDEPEISLHVAWQIRFLQDIQSILDLTSFDVIIATHSPQIINDNWNLTVELQGPKQ